MVTSAYLRPAVRIRSSDAKYTEWVNRRLTPHPLGTYIRTADVASDDQAAPTHPATCETSLADSTEG